MRINVVGIALAAALLAACSQRETDFVPAPGRPEAQFFACFEQPEEGTKVYVAEDLHLRWNAEDRISVFDQLTYNSAFVFAGQEGDAGGSFGREDPNEIEIGETVPNIVAVYPYDETTSLSEAQVLSLTLPAEQAYAGNSFGQGANTMVSVSEDDHFFFKNVGGYLQLRLYGDNVRVRSITLQGNAAEKLSGAATVTMPLGGEPSVTMSEGAGETITLRCENPVSLGVSAADATPFWLVLPPVSLSKGFSILVTDEDGKTYGQSSGRPLEIQRNRLSRMAPLCVLPTSGEEGALASKIDVLSVSANQVSYYEGPVEDLIDGDYFTYYHSPYEIPTEFPVVWEFEFAGNERLDYISMMHRALGDTPGANYRGQIGQFNVYYKAGTSSSYVLAQQFDFGGNGGYQTAHLKQPIENVRRVKIEILNGDPYADYYVDGTYITCAEVEFYHSQAPEVNQEILTVFTDLSCSELLPGVTPADITRLEAVSPTLARRVALPLLNRTYDEKEKDFRIHRYEPYSDSRVNRALATGYYTSMNNPTGIEVVAGDQIIVCVDQIPDGQTVGLAIYGEGSDGNEPNYGGTTDVESIGQSCDLEAGINSIPITASGMLYVMNVVPPENRLDMSEFAPVKVHIIPGCGNVQGYFDPARHSDADYQELLDRCSYKYFMMKGEKCMFLFHTDRLREVFPESVRPSLALWDKLVGWEHELMGIDKTGWFNNHLLAVSTTNSSVFLDASNRRVRLHVDALSYYCDPEGMAEDNIWGGAHEMGHINQLAINWRSTTESSNNLFSNYCLRQYFDEGYYQDHISRGATISELADAYLAQQPWAYLGTDMQSYQGENAELHMRMNWQLWNYYHNCGVKTDFFPALFAYMRDGHHLPNQQAESYYGLTEDLGLCQLEYYEACCAVAGQDLTEFFDTWGFFRLIDEEYSQYGSAQYTVTQERVDASQARVRAMNLPPAPPIQYLEDRTTKGSMLYSEMGFYTQFRDKVKITKLPSALVLDDLLILSNCEEAVAVEIREGSTADGGLLYFTNWFYSLIPDGVSLEGNSLWAVQSDGERIKITIE